MSVICLNNLTPGAMIFSINSVANKAFREHTSGEQFTEVEQRQIYEDLVQAIRQDLFDGDIATRVINPMMADRAVGKMDTYMNYESTLLAAFDELQNSILLKEALSSRKKTKATTYRFPKAPSELHYDIFNKFVVTKVEPSTPTITESQNEAYDTPVESTTGKDVDTGSALIKRTLAQYSEHMDPVLLHLKDVVSKTWVDGEVRADGTAKGFSGLKNTATMVKARLQSKIYNYMASRANGTFSIVKGRNNERYLFFERGRTPLDFVETKTSEDGVLSIGELSTFKVLTTDNGASHVRVIVGDNFTDAIERLSKENELSTVDENMSPIDTGLEYSLTNPAGYATEDLSVFYSYLLTNGKNYATFLAAQYPTLSDAYRPRFKTNYSEPGTVSGQDQDSAALKLHQQTTPRLVIGPNGRSIDSTNPYLTEADFAMVSPELSSFASDLPSISRALLAAISSSESVAKQNILASIYYRFFHPYDYEVIDADGNEITMRSYAGILANQRTKDVSVQEYERAKKSGVSLETPNAALESSLSSIVTSFRSLVPNDQFGDRNGRADITNITGGGKNIWQFNTDFIGSTATSTVTGTTTDNKYFENNRIMVSEAKDPKTGKKRTGPNGEPRVNITIRKSPYALVDPSKAPSITYEVQVNFAKTDPGAPLQFQAGIPITITDKSSDTPLSETAEVFAGFNFPAFLTSAYYRTPLLDAIGRAKLENENNLGTITTSKGVEVDVSLDNLYMNMLFTMMLNGDQKVGPIGALFSAVTMPAPALNATIAYNPIDTMYGYSDVLSDIILHTVGELGNSHSRTYDGERIAEFIQTSHLNLTKKLADTPTRLNENNVLSTGEYIAGKTYADKGKVLGDENKTVETETELEKMTKNIEIGFIQLGARSRENNEVLIKPGAQSDRLHPKYKAFKATNPRGIFILEKDTIDNGVDNTELASIMGIKPSEAAGLDVYTLTRKAVGVQRNYYNNLHNIAVSEWNKALGTTFTTLQQVANELKKNPQTYDDVKAKSGLVDYSIITKDSKGNAIVPEDILQSIAVFSNDTLALEYMEVMRRMFIKDLANMGYTRISSNAIKDVMDKIAGLKISGEEETARQATAFAFNAYFYNAQILGVSALNIHTGGVAQYKLKSAGEPFFSMEKSFTNGQLNIESVISQAKSLKVPGSKLTLGEISTKELLDLRTQSAETGPLKKSEQKLNRLSYMKVILENKSFADDITKAKALMFNDMTRHLNDKLVDQVKRNAPLGTAMQLPRIVSTFEPGMFLGKTSKNVIISDNEPEVDVIGTSGKKSVVATDGVQMFHPLFSMKVNNSLGNDESSFKYSGVAMKDLVIGTDENGSIEMQKEAAFGSFDHDLNRKGSALIDQTLERMNTAVKFTSSKIMVEVPGKTTWSAITEDQWKTNGLALGFLKFKDGTTEKIIHSSKLLAQLRYDPATTIQQIKDGKYFTDKVERHFNNMQELWEYFGASTKADSWSKVAQVIGYHSGLGTTEMDLADANYPLRDAYIEKVGYTSKEKTGAKNVITWENFLNPDYKFRDEETHKDRWLEVSNEHAGFILQAEHNYDTTSSHTGLYSEDNEEQKENQVSLITQIISAASAEGMSLTEANSINDTIGVLSDAALDGLNRKVVAMTILEHPELAGKEKLLMDIFSEGVSATDTDTLYAKELYEGALEYSRQLISRSLEKNSKDTGLATELLAVRLKANTLTFDQKQLLPLFQSQLFADFNKKTVRMKMPGGQFVVSPSHAFLPTYDLIEPHPSGDGTNGRTILSGLNREDMNKMFYGPAYNKLNAVQKAAIDHSFPLKKLTDLSKVKLSDNIVTPKGTTVVFNDIKQRLKVEYDNGAMPEATFQQYLYDQLVTNNDYGFRFGHLDSKTKESNRLKWAQWLRYDKATGAEINILSTDEYRSYNEIDPIGKSYLSGKTYIQHFGYPSPTAESSKKQPKGKQQERELKTTEAIRNNIPLGLVKEFFFGTIYESTKGLANPTEILSPEHELKFTEWWNSVDVLKAAEATYNYIGSKASVDSNYNKAFKAKVYNLLQDESLGWVSIPAETYMPHMHASAFLIEESDTLHTFTGLNELPSTNKLESMGILTHQQAIEFSFNYKAAYGKYFNTLDPTQQLFFMEEYGNKMNVMKDHLVRVFKERVSNLYGIDAKPNANLDEIASPTNLFYFEDTTTDKMLIAAIWKRNSSTIGSSQYNAMNDLVTELKKSESLRKLGLNHKDSLKIRDTIRQKFINDKVEVLSSNFLKTLDFIMARIPAQGKQSFIHARMKNLIFSSKNSVYGPIELILIAGLDYDIDKQNMMTWGLDDDGNIVDWNDYMVASKLDVETLNTKIAQHAQLIKDVFDNERIRLENRLQEVETELETAPELGPEYNRLQKDRTKLQNDLTNLGAKLSSALEKAEDADRVLFTKAGQNYIVHNLIEVISSPKNAIEANTPISTNSVVEAKIQPNIENLFTDKINTEDLFISQQITTNMNPVSTIQYEKINMDGKSGIGIYAADLKAYLAAFYATRMSKTEKEQSRVRLKSDLTKLPKALADKYGVDPTVLQFFKTNGEVVNMSVIANAKRWTSANVTLTTEAKQALRELKSIPAEDVAAQYEIMKNYAEKVGIMNSMNVEQQAWEGLSQLLTAATDNAKELILGKIGANNTTNSVISTMVRMGVSLSDAIPLINHPTIKEIVKDIERGKDLTIKAVENKKLALQGIVLEEAFNERLAERLLKASKSVPSEGASETTVREYLTDPARTLHTYAKIAAEFSTLTRLLGINQGLKNSAYEVHAYVSGINDSINKAISDYNDANKNDQVQLKFDLREFVTSVRKGGDVEALFDAMDKVRTGINVPYVLFKNAHYFSYFKALFQAENVRDRLSFTNAYVASIIESAKAKYKKKSQLMTKGVYNKIADTIYDFSIVSFLEDVKGPRSPLSLKGSKYDLSKAKAEGEILGRAEFLKNLPSIIDGIKGNDFIDSLQHNQVSVDPMTGANVSILKGKDLAVISSMEYARLAKGLLDLKTGDKEVYDALFYYSLIVSKGAWAGGNFMGLFNIEEYLKFAKYIKDNLSTIKTNINSHKDLIYLLNPLLLPQVTTIAPTDKKLYDVEQDQEDEVALDMTPFDDDLSVEPSGNATVYWKQLTKEKFRLDHLNEEKRREGTRLEAEFFRSKNNNMTYQWNGVLGIWVPLTSDIPHEAIHLSVVPAEQDYISVDKEANLTQGFTVNMPSTSIITGQLEQGTVLGYVTNRMKSLATTYFEKIAAREENVEPGLEPTLLNLLRSESNRDLKRPIYIVKPENGSYMIYTKELLEKYNHGFTFDEGFIAAGSKILDNTEVKTNPSIRVYVKGTEYYNTIPVDAKLGEYLMTDLENITSQTYDSSPTHFYDEATVKKMLKDVNTGNVVDSYSTAVLDQEYQKFVDGLIDRLVVLSDENTSTVEDATRKRLAGYNAGPSTVNLITKISGTVISTLGGTNPSIVTKIRTLQGGEQKFLNVLSQLQGGDKVLPGGLPDIQYIKPTHIPKAAIEFLNNKFTKNNVTQMSLAQFRELGKILKVSDDIFDTFVTSVFLKNSEIDMLTRNDGYIYLRTGPKISASKQLASIEDRIVKGKPIYLPEGMRYEYIKPANKAVLYALTRFLNNRLPGVTWNLMTTAQIKEKYGNEYAINKGIFKADGEIIINMDKATLETPLHEFGHVYLQYLNEESPEEYQRLMELAKEHALYKIMGKTYSKLSSVDLAEEVFCEILSMSAANKIVANPNGVTERIINSVSDSTGRFGKVIQTIKNWIQSMFTKIGLAKTVKSATLDIELSLGDSLGTVIDSLSDEILYGTDSILNKFSDETKSQIRKSRSGSTVTLKEARDILLARGYMEWYCV